MANGRLAATVQPPNGHPGAGGDTVARIVQSYHGLSKGQRRVADLALSEPATVAVSSAAKIAGELGTSTSTVVRFATTIGFAGYPDFQRALQSDLFRDISTVSRLQITKDQLADRTAGALIRDVLERDAEHITRSVALIHPDEFEACVRLLNGARRVHVIGLWSSHAPASLLTLGLRHIGIDARLLGTDARDLTDDLHGASAEDVLVAISIRRYPTRLVALLDLAGSRGLPRVAITDDPRGPLATRARHALCFMTSDDRFFRPITPAVSVVNALVTACVLADPARAQRSLASLEDIWAQTGAHATETRPPS